MLGSDYWVLLLIGRKISRLFGFYYRHSDWLNFGHFPGYKIKVKLVCRLTKRGDQALNSISTIQELPSLVNYSRIRYEWYWCLIEFLKFFLFRYAVKYNEQLLVTLEEDEFSCKLRLAYKLEQVHNIMQDGQ